MKKIRFENIAAIYLVFLGIFALLNSQFPPEFARLVNFIFPAKIDLTSQDFIRYRMVLFVSATILLLILAPIIRHKGIEGTNSETFKSMHWGHCMAIIFLLPIGWVGFPLVALCLTCWTANDTFYFLLTVSFFLALQVTLHALISKAFPNRKIFR